METKYVDNPWATLGEHLVAVAHGAPVDEDLVRSVVAELAARLDFERRLDEDDVTVWTDEGIEPGIYLTEEGEARSYLFDPANAVFKGYDTLTGEVPLEVPGSLLPVVQQGEMFSLFEGMVEAILTTPRHLCLSDNGGYLLGRTIRANSLQEATIRHLHLYKQMPAVVLTPPPPEGEAEWEFTLVDLRPAVPQSWGGKLVADEKGWSWGFSPITTSEEDVPLRGQGLAFDEALNALWKAIHWEALDSPVVIAG